MYIGAGRDVWSGLGVYFGLNTAPRVQVGEAYGRNAGRWMVVAE